MNKDKWIFCPDKKCAKCFQKITEKEEKGEEVVTRCPYCNWSFCE